MEGITDCLRKELVHTPIRVTSIQPGLAETECGPGSSMPAPAPHTGLPGSPSCASRATLPRPRALTPVRPPMRCLYLKADAPCRLSGIQPLVADDIADSIVYVASRPEHVQIGHLSLTPTNQASTEVVHRTT